MQNIQLNNNASNRSGYFCKTSSGYNVWFYDLAADGFSLDDKRTPIQNNDLPDLIAQYKKYRKAIDTPSRHPRAGGDPAFSDRTQKAFLVPKEEIASQKYDLSINRYKKVVYQEESYAPPKEILRQLKKLEQEIMQDFFELEAML